METIWSNDKVMVQVNSSGEVFVTELQRGNYVRISDSQGCLIITAQSSLMIPTAVNGLSAFRVEKR